MSLLLLLRAPAASGTASLTLDASGGSASAAVTSTASLALSASGSTSAAASATGSLSLSASGSVVGVATAAAALSLSASGATAAPVTAAGSLSLSASGSLTGVAAGAGSLTLGASGSVSAAATASGSLSLSASGSWTLTPTTAALSLSASGAAKGVASASASISLSASVITTSAYSTTILADSPLGYWRMGESSGTTLTDTSGNTHNGSYVGTAGSTYTLAQTGATIEGDTAVKFSGTPNTGPAGYANVPYAAWMDATSAISVEAWVKWLGAPAASGTGGAGLAFRWQNNSGSVTVGGLWLDTADHIVAQFVVAGSTKSVSTGVEPTVGHWTHCVAVYDGAHVILYIDGVSVGTPAVATGSLTTGNCDLQIGAYKDGQWCLPNHVVDEVAYYNTALSPTRVAAHYSAATTVVTAVAGVASGSASLSLSGSGSAKAAATAAASLSLSASGAVTPPAITAAGSLALSATGSWTLTPSTGSLTLSASGVTSAPVTAAASLSLSASGTSQAAFIAGLTFSDNFNRADGAVGANWTTVGAGPLNIVSNQLAGGTTSSAIRWATTTAGDNQVVQATYLGGTAIALALAMPALGGSLSATGQFYVFRQNVSGTIIGLKDTGVGTASTLASSATNLTAGDVFKLEYVNGVLNAYINGSLTITTVPTPILTGQRGVGAYLSTTSMSGVALIDNWSAGDYVGESTANLALSASGATQAPTTATASLALSASGSTQAPAVGAAVLTLGATGTAASGAVAASGSASLTLGATGSVSAPMSAAAAVSLTASGTAPLIAVTSTAALTLSASGTAPAAATASASLLLSASLATGGGTGVVGTPQVSVVTQRSGGEPSSPVAYPTTVNAGDLLVLIGTLGLSSTSINPPAGWVEVFDLVPGSFNTPELWVSIRYADGTEGGTTVSVPHGNGAASAWQILAFPGVDAIIPQDVTHSEYSSTTASTTMGLPSVTVATAGTALVAIGAIGATTASATPPTGFTEAGDSGTVRSLDVSYKLNVSAGATGTETITWDTSGKGVGGLLALRPAAVTGGGGTNTSGSGSLTLSASGATRGVETASASLTLTSSAITAARAAAAASLSLTATATVPLAAAASGSLSLSALAWAGAPGKIQPIGELGSAALSSVSSFDVTSSSRLRVPIGSMLLLVFAFDNPATTTEPTITFSNNNTGSTWQKATGLGSGVTTTAGSGVWTEEYYVYLGADVNYQDLISTVSLGFTPTSVIWGVYAFAGVLSGGPTTAPSTGTSAVGTPSSPQTITAGNTEIGVATWKSAGAFTPDAGASQGTWEGGPSSTYASVVQSGAGPVEFIIQWKKNFPATSLQTYNPTGPSVNSSTILAQFAPTPSTLPATATASLSLSASGSTKATASAAGSLSLSATGDTRAPTSGSGSLSLSASGAWTLTPSSASLALSASGSAVAPTSAAASVTLGATGATTSPTSATAALALSASGTTSGTNAASGTASLTLSGSGAARGALVAGTAFSDNFNRADGALGTNWAVSGAGPFTIASNQVVGGTTTSMARWTTATVSDNQVSQITYLGGSFSGAVVAIAAVAGGGSVANSGTWYALRQGTVTTGNLQLVQKDTGLTTFTTLASTGSALVSGDVIKLTYVGGVLTGYVNGTQVLTNTPASPITGQRGVGFAHNSSVQSGTPVLDNWSGGDYVGESTASLTLSASGVTGSLPATGTAALTLGATGAATVSTTSTAALSLSASGVTAASAAASGSLTLSTTGFITTFGTAAGTAALTLAASGAARAALIPGLTFSDDFNVPDGSLSSNWQTTTTPPTITNNQVVGGSATGAARWIVDTATDNQFVQATYLGGTSVGVAVAMPSLAGSPAQAGVLPFYTFRQLTAGGGVAISIKNAPSNIGYTALVSSATNLVAGDVIRLEYVSGTLTAKINGTTILTTTPGTPITGQHGVGFNAIGQTGVAILDNWSGGDNVSSSQASLTLSATGSVVPSIASSGTASLTLGASAATSVALGVTYSGALPGEALPGVSLPGSIGGPAPVVAGVASGTASLTLGALGSGPVPAAGTASLTLSATGTGRAALIAGVAYADDFNRPDGALGANWAQTGPAASAPVIVGQQVVGGTAGAAERWINPTNTDNQFVQATYSGSGSFVSVALAMPAFAAGTGLAAAGTWYVYRQSAAGTGNIGTFQKDLGATTFTGLTNTPSVTLVAGDVIRLEYVNGTLNGFVNGVLHGFFTPTTPITGQRYVGFEHSSNQSGTPLIDNWSAGDYVQPSAASLTLSASGAILPATAVSATASLTLGASGTAQARLTAGTTFSDNFNRANGALGSNWEVTTGAATISANHVVAAASANSERWVTDTTNDDQFSQATYLGGVSVGVAVAMSPQPGTPVYAGVDPFYVLRQESASAGVIIGVKLAGTGIVTTLASSPQNLVAGDVFKLEYFGGVLTGRINGAVVATYTPPAPITGQRGVGFMHSLANQGGTPLIDDWSGGDYVPLSTAALTLGASGTTRVSTTASASLALTASGAVSGTAAATGSLSLAASGVTSIPAVGSASLTLGATALSFGSTAAGTASLTLDASVIAITAHEYPGALPGRYRPGITRPGSSFVFPVTAIPAAAAGSASLSLSASGAALLATAGTGSLTLSAHGTAGAAPSAVASLTLSASGVTPTVTMSGAAALVLAASGATQVPVTSAAALTLAASGATQPQLTAAAALTLAATGTTAAQPTATASLVLAASGVAPTARLTGTAALTLLASGSSTSPVSGNASLTLAATGTAPPILVTASAALALAAVGALQTSVSAAAVLTLGAAGTAIGIMPITGTASLSLSASGFALFGSPGFLAQMTLSATAGTLKAVAAATAALSLTAQSSTQSLASGSATLTLTTSGTARAALTASAAMSLSATGAVKAAMSAAAAMVLTATGGPASAAARATAALTLAGQGSGATRASGTGFIVLSGGASAATRVSGLGHLDLTSQAVTSSRVSGTASLSTFAAATARASLSGLASITLAGSAVIIADTTLYTIWNGTGYDQARLLGLWNGTSYDQVTVLGEWNGTGYNELTPVP